MRLANRYLQRHKQPSLRGVDRGLLKLQSCLASVNIGVKQLAHGNRTTSLGHPCDRMYRTGAKSSHAAPSRDPQSQL